MIRSMRESWGWVGVGWQISLDEALLGEHNRAELANATAVQPLNGYQHQSAKPSVQWNQTLQVYEEVKDSEVLQSTVEEYLGEFNAESKQPMHLVMFGDAIDHVSRISRVIRCDNGVEVNNFLILFNNKCEDAISPRHYAVSLCHNLWCSGDVLTHTLSANTISPQRYLQTRLAYSSRCLTTLHVRKLDLYFILRLCFGLQY